jgi:thiamine biosynthesis lipoprotein
MKRHVFPTMGTMVSVTFDDGGHPPLKRVERVFADADHRFSLYRDDSELARIAAGTLNLADASIAVLDSYSAAVEWRNSTDGAFNPNRPDGVVDLNGIVKAEAMRRAGDELHSAGCHDWSLVVGGDLLASGVGPGGTPWATGVIDPANRAALLCSVVLRGSRRAIATSGSAERGDHIWLGGGITSPDFVQVTVVADDIVTADVLATAIVAGGSATLDDACDRWSIDVLTVNRGGELQATPGLRAALAA